MIKPGKFVKPPGAKLVTSSQEAWDTIGTSGIVYAKQDGWRIQIHTIAGQNLFLFSRTGKDYAEIFAQTAQHILTQVGDETVILDVEMVGYDASDQPLPPTHIRQAHYHKCWLLDSLFLDGKDLTGLDTTKRVEHLLTWIAKHPGSCLVPSEFLEFSSFDNWTTFFTACLRQGLEGIILKERSNDYFKKAYKVKPTDYIDVVVVAGNRDVEDESKSGFKNLLLAAPASSSNRLVTLGFVDRDEQSDLDLWAQITAALQPLKQPYPPEQIDNVPIIPTTWFAPKVVLEVEAGAARNEVDPRYTLGGQGGPGYKLVWIKVRRLREDKATEDATDEDDLIRRFEIPPISNTQTTYQLSLFGASHFTKDTPVTKGQLEIIVGCMFSGKTTKLIERAKEYRNNGAGVLVFYPAADNRSLVGQLSSHDGLKFAAQKVENANVLREKALSAAEQYIVIDEAQFFDEAIVDVCLELTAQGRNLLVAGLDLDFRGKPFGPVPQLMACADKIEKLAAKCSVCEDQAYFSQRLPDGRPANYFEEIVVPGGSELYQPRCRQHHTVPGKSLKLTRSVEQELANDLVKRLWDWGQRLRAIGQIGLHFTKTTYDRERYDDILRIAKEMLTCPELVKDHGLIKAISQWLDHLASGYVTPKTAVAMAVFNADGDILLIQRSDDNNWSLPGGWADVGFSPVENVLREVYQETGMEAHCDGLVGIYDNRLAPVGLTNEHVYTILFCGHSISTDIAPHREEVLQVRFFNPNGDDFPDLVGGSKMQVSQALDCYHGISSHTGFDPPSN
jgi:thymidine kinase